MSIIHDFDMLNVVTTTGDDVRGNKCHVMRAFCAGTSDNSTFKIVYKSKGTVWKVLRRELSIYPDKEEQAETNPPQARVQY